MIALFPKIFKTITFKKNARKYFYPCIKMMKLQKTLKDISIWMKNISELFCIKNGFAKCPNLFI